LTASEVRQNHPYRGKLLADLTLGP
jgi:hypothetical protein